jgi:hypothetical protein
LSEAFNDKEIQFYPTMLFKIFPENVDFALMNCQTFEKYHEKNTFSSLFFNNKSSFNYHNLENNILLQLIGITQKLYKSVQYAFHNCVVNNSLKQCNNLEVLKGKDKVGIKT